MKSVNDILCLQVKRYRSNTQVNDQISHNILLYVTHTGYKQSLLNDANLKPNQKVKNQIYFEKKEEQIKKICTARCHI